MWNSDGETEKAVPKRRVGRPVLAEKHGAEILRRCEWRRLETAGDVCLKTIYKFVFREFQRSVNTMSKISVQREERIYLARSVLVDTSFQASSISNRSARSCLSPA